MLPRLMFASERDTLSVVHNGTDHTVVQAGDVVMCYQWNAGGIPALPSGFTSLATDSASLPNIGQRVSYEVADGPITVAPDNLLRLIVLRPTRPVLVSAVVNPIDLASDGDPLGLIYWGIRCASGSGNTPTAATVTPAVSIDVNFRYNDNRTTGDTNHGSCVCSVFIGPEKTLDPISYTGNNGTNTDFRGWLKIRGQ